MHKPLPERHYQPVQKVQDEHSVFLDEDELVQGGNTTTKTLFYAVNNMCIKITHQGEQIMDSAGLGNLLGGNTSTGGGLDTSYMTQQQQNQ